MFFKLPPGVVEIDPTFISDGTLDKETWRSKLDYYWWRVRCWAAIKINYFQS